MEKKIQKNGKKKCKKIKVEKKQGRRRENPHIDIFRFIDTFFVLFWNG